MPREHLSTAKPELVYPDGPLYLYCRVASRWGCVGPQVMPAQYSIPDFASILMAKISLQSCNLLVKPKLGTRAVAP